MHRLCCTSGFCLFFWDFFSDNDYTLSGLLYGLLRKIILKYKINSFIFCNRLIQMRVVGTRNLSAGTLGGATQYFVFIIVLPFCGFFQIEIFLLAKKKLQVLCTSALGSLQTHQLAVYCSYQQEMVGWCWLISFSIL